MSSTDFRTDWLTGKSVLITGNAGYIGSALMERLRDSNVRYLGIDKRAGDDKRARCFNLCDAGRLNRVIAEFSPDHVVHCGTHSAVVYRERFLDSFEEDVSAMSNLLRVLKDRPGTRLMLLSSSYVYSGLDLKRPAKETDVLSPAHNFGVAKAFFEQYALRIHPNSVVFRLSSVFGGGDRPCPNAITDMAKEFKERGTLTVWGAGARMMQYVHIDDVIAYILHGLRIPPGIYNLGGNEYASIGETAKIIADYFATDVRYLRDRKEGETLPFMENVKLKHVVGADLFVALTSSLRWYLAGQFKHEGKAT